METRRRYALLYFGDQWDDLWRRRQQLAVQFARQPDVARVVYVELPLPLTSLASFAAGRADRDAVARWRRVLRHGTVIQREGVTIVTPIVPFRLYSGARASAWNARFAWRQVRRVCARGGPPDGEWVFWAGHPYAGLFRDRMPHALICYDYTEDYATFEHLSPACRALFAELDQQLTRKADLVFAQTEPHLLEKRRSNPSTYLLPNAVDIGRLLAAGESPEPSEMAQIPRPRIGLAGSIGYRVDADLLAFVAAQRPRWSLLLIGPVDRGPVAARLGRFSNVHFLGHKPYGDLGRYLRWIDVGLIPYRVLPEMGNPLKLYDYLTFGKPVVATPILGMDRFSDWVLIGRTPADFVALVERALGQTDPALVARRQEYARQQSWEARARTIWELVSARMREAQARAR